MQNLVIDDRTKSEIARIKKYSEEHRIPMDQIIATIKDPEKSVGNDPEHCCILSEGYKAVFSIEEQPSGFCRHFSLSVDDERSLPSPPSFEAIMKELGFEGLLCDCENVWLEENVSTSSGKIGTAINVLQKI